MINVEVLTQAGNRVAAADIADPASIAQWLEAVFGTVDFMQPTPRNYPCSEYIVRVRKND